MTTFRRAFVNINSYDFPLNQFDEVDDPQDADKVVVLESIGKTNDEYMCAIFTGTEDAEDALAFAEFKNNQR